ncbi:sugar phosphate isomerase/epimerase family protein [Nigerium massiliense]|uniref:sugar phosphate isomerase/epimerase family protein n=1 Tax=Nigerium massiliense TaxID=1522317 RepID=UPI00058F465E|nr:sugar phosphate isomerase/epimerase family protein [Nigerium massiliense]
MRWRLSGFVDEAAPTLRGQVRLAQAADLDAIELRLALGRPVLRWDDRTVERAASLVAAAGLGVSCVATGLGKQEPGLTPRAMLDDFQRACDVAHKVGCRNIRAFSFRVPEGTEDRYAPLVTDRLGELTTLSEGADVVLLLENEKGTVGSSPERCAAIASDISSERFRLIFDPANFVQCGHRPATDAYPLLRPWVAALHVKDADAHTGRVVPAGQGDGQLPELIAALKADGFDGTASIEPHLGLGGRGGPSSPSRWREAANAFRALVNNAGLDA